MAKKKIAIIGASIGQKELCLKAKEMGLYSISFAWEEGAICKHLVDKFYPISILEKDAIVDICKQEQVDGVVSNASDLTAEVAAYVSEQLGLNGNTYDIIQAIENKGLSRKRTAGIKELSDIDYYLYDNQSPHFLPCIIKPQAGGGKVGVSFAKDETSFQEGIAYAKGATDAPILIERFIEGSEVSVESISFHGKHYVIQITDKVTSGAPHFVELAHHQPSQFPQSVKQKIEKATIAILDSLNFQNGASHVELKVTNQGEVYLIEVNARGGGDHISNKLVMLSTGYDYVKAMIHIALNDFEPPTMGNNAYSGIYYLCQQTSKLLPLFEKDTNESWMTEKVFDNQALVNSLGNATRNGYFIYQSNHRILLNI